MIADPKLSQNSAQIPSQENKYVPPPPSNYEIVPSDEIAAAAQDTDFDIRPRVYDARLKEWVLIDTGSQVSCLKPDPDATINPYLKLETVDGSEIPTIWQNRMFFHLEHTPRPISDRLSFVQPVVSH